MTIERAMDIIDAWLAGELTPESALVKKALEVFDEFEKRLQAQAIKLAQRVLKDETCIH